MIALNNISVGYSTELIHSEVISLQEGKVYVLIGKNGAGKTTLFNSIIGQQNLLQGTIAIKDVNIEHMNAQDIARNVAFVPANFPSVEYMRVLDFIGLGRSPYTNHFGHLTQNDLNVINEILSLLGIDNLKNAFVTELSDGQRQLVSIAKALAQETPVILLDEPLAFLDFSNRRELLKKLNRMAKEQNKCILFSSHDIDVSLSESFEYLLIHEDNRKLELISSPTRSEIIDICFPE